MKQSKSALMARIVGWFVLFLVLLVVLVVETNPWWSQFGCNDAGYKEHRIYAEGIYISGQANGMVLSRFPAFGEYRRSVDGEILADAVNFYYQYVQCVKGFHLRPNPDVVQVARFSLPSEMNFEGVDLDSYLLVWRKKYGSMFSSEPEKWPPLMLYAKSDVRGELPLELSDLKEDRRSDWRSWFAGRDGRRGYFEKIANLKVDWLKDENLDESQFMGLWHSGFLFKSKKEGSYIWIDVGL